MGAEKPEQVEENLSLMSVKKISNATREKIIEAFNNIDERVLQPWLWNK
jgi:aryl-alcohol dehydrogenase-like predicted oxidoreductase